MRRGMKGNFCSWGCAMAWSQERGGRVGERHNRMRVLMKEQEGVPMVTSFPAAPPREALAVFGGTMSVEEFRGAGGAKVLEAPLVGCIPKEFEILVGAGFTMRRDYKVGGKHVRYSCRLSIKEEGAGGE